MPTLLAIDDEVEFTNLLRNYFTPRGYQDSVAYDGEQGLQIAQREKPDICLIDLKMPGMPGDELLKQILKTVPKTKCIMITASEGEGKTRASLMELGAYTCFDKPLTSLKDLEDKIREALKKDNDQ